AGPDGRIGSFVVELATQAEKWLNNTFLSQPPAWSPDGQYLVWYGDDGAIQQQEIATGNITRLYDGAGADIKRPIWTPDGTRLVFSINRQLAVLDTITSRLQIMSSAGSPQSVYAWRP
ncbi:MAG: PD40 domain-containing protein, partial [Anaerolineae bacterium]|nr:PD40 domain-containing protein [Anaerolineae bacterium]